MLTKLTDMSGHVISPALRKGKSQKPKIFFCMHTEVILFLVETYLIIAFTTSTTCHNLATKITVGCLKLSSIYEESHF